MQPCRRSSCRTTRGPARRAARAHELRGVDHRAPRQRRIGIEVEHDAVRPLDVRRVRVPRVQLDRAHLRGAEQRIDAVDRQQRPVAGIQAPSCCVTNGISRRSACFWKNSSPAMSPGAPHERHRPAPSGPAAATARPIASSARGRSCACRLRIEHPLGMRDAHAADTIGGGPRVSPADADARAPCLRPCAVSGCGACEDAPCAARVSFIVASVSVGRGTSRTICRAGLSSRSAMNAACRTMPSLVHSANSHSATSVGSTQWTRVRDRSRGGGSNGVAALVPAQSPRAGRADACRTRCRPDRHSATAVCRVAACRPRPVRTRRAATRRSRAGCPTARYSRRSRTPAAAGISA